MDEIKVETNDPSTANKPFWDSIKRIGEQARNWENISDFGADLDILKPNHKRRIALSPKMLITGAALITVFMTMQAVFIYAELRAQRIAIEKLQTTLQTVPKIHGKTGK